MNKLIKEILPYIIIILVVVLIRSYIITPVQVEGSSMETTLNDKEILLLSKISYINTDISRYDIIVIQNENEKIIKRVYGMPGEKIDYRNDKLYINDELVEDNYASNKTNDFSLKDICIAGLKRQKIVSEEEIKTKCDYDVIPKGYYLVLGDNRKVSADSRYYGLISKDKIVGKAVVRFWPLNKLDTLD